MGVPAFYRWLARTFPKIQRVVQREDTPFSAANPSGVEVDTLLVDANGVLHNCSHPEDRPAPRGDEEMFAEIFRALDGVMRMTRPRRIVYIAVDGCAPRAKMNQQRSRRFRTAREAAEIAASKPDGDGGGDGSSGGEEAVFDSNCITPGTQWLADAATALRYWAMTRAQDPAYKGVKFIVSDASVPGEGEHKIMEFIRRNRASEGYDPNQTHCLYGLDADLIMLGLATHEANFLILREDVFGASGKTCHTCGQPGHQANQCRGTAAVDERGKDAKDGPASANSRDEPKTIHDTKPFIYVEISVLREYLDAWLRPTSDQGGFPFDLERAIDDFVLICFWVGNDFLPHLPSLDIREGAIPKLLNMYRRRLPQLGYLSERGKVNIPPVLELLREVGAREDQVFRDRKNKDLQFKNSRRDKRKREGRKAKASDDEVDAKRQKILPAPSATAGLSTQTAFRLAASGQRPTVDPNLAAAQRLKEELGLDTADDGGDKDNKSNSNKTKGNGNETGQVILGTGSVVANKDSNKDSKGGQPKGTKRSAPATEILDLGEEEAPEIIKKNLAKEEAVRKRERELEERAERASLAGLTGASGSVVGLGGGSSSPAASTSTSSPSMFSSRSEDTDPYLSSDAEDDVRLHEHGWKDRYYRNKFNVDVADVDFRRRVCRSYLEGICWVFEYYYRGVPSWTWYYPYHYAPFASDFAVLGKDDVEAVTFEVGKPFRPLNQLMGVFPAASASAIPDAYRALMTDPESPIIDFYPEDFEIDLNGKKQAWQGVVLLPFIDEKRLLDAIATVEHTLTPAEQRRNTFGRDVLIVGGTDPISRSLTAVYGPPPLKNPLPINPIKSNGLCGSLLPFDGFKPGSDYETDGYSYGTMPTISKVEAVMAEYRMPEYPEGFAFESKVLEGAKLPRPVLSQADKDKVSRGGHRDGGNRGPQFHGHYMGHSHPRENVIHGSSGRGGGRGGGGRGGYNQGYQGRGGHQQYGHQQYGHQQYGHQQQQQHYYPPAQPPHHPQGYPPAPPGMGYAPPPPAYGYQGYPPPQQPYGAPAPYANPYAAQGRGYGRGGNNNSRGRGRGGRGW